MFLTETHLKKLREIATESEWRFSRPMRNILYLNGTDGDFQTRVKIRRQDDGSYNVVGDLGCTFNGTEADFALFTTKCLSKSDETAKVRKAAQSYLDAEVAACTGFKPSQMQTMGQLILHFEKWIDPISIAVASERGLTAVDPVVHTMFSGAENIDLALQGGRIEVDSGPDKTANVWVSRDYLYPLAKQISDYLNSQDWVVTISTTEVFFLDD